MLVEIIKLTPGSPHVGLEVNKPLIAQLLRLPEVGHPCCVKGVTTANVTEITKKTSEEIHFKTKISEYILKLNQ